MTVPYEYQRCRDHFDAFLRDLAETAGVETTHRAYTMTQGVLMAFRRRLTHAQSIRFVGALPVGLRALYVAAWNPDEPLAEPGTRADWVHEARSLRAGHNFATETCVHEVAACVRRHVQDPALFERVIGELPAWAGDFWSV